ncbi:MAG: sporulation protein YunB [Oscillospiraceae bacterium]|nr:sporulation protein YunB [Oscillospiraceae bacterium]
MRYKKLFHRRSPYVYSEVSGNEAPGSKVHSLRFIIIGLLAILFLLVVTASVFLKDISSQIAVSDASDIVTVSVNNAISQVLASGDYTGNYFVDFEKDANGDVTAISSNMAKINTLSAQILEKVVGTTEKNTITVKIPSGNLTGISLLMGRGPKVPVKIIVLTSSRVEFNNNIITAGINQTKHQINLEVIVDVEILVPWGSETAQVVTEVLIADTVIVGEVPDTYLNM